MAMAVSQHLKVLKNAGLVKGERWGYRVHYFVNREALDRAQELISAALQLEEVELRANNLGKRKIETKQFTNY